MHTKNSTPMTSTSNSTSTSSTLTSTPSTPVALGVAVSAASNTDEAFGSSQKSLQSSLSRLQRLRQYQPSQYLVKIMFVWWLVVVFATAIELTDGFGIEALTNTSPILFNLSILTLLLLAAISLFDLLWLVAMSQPSNYRLFRDYPSNVPIYHELDIDAYLSFVSKEDSKTNTVNMASSIAAKLYDIGLISTIKLDFSDSYPEQLLLADNVNRINNVTSEQGARSATMSVPVTFALRNNQDSGTEQAQVRDIKTSTVKISYPVIPVQRGTGYFGVGYIRVWSLFKLIHRQFTITDHQQHHHYLRVLADFSGLLNNQLSAMFEKSQHAGTQALMQQGHGSDFLKLREYASGDAIRQIDWKASSRQRRLMSKSYEEDNDQEVVFLLDCGEQMRHQDDDNQKSSSSNATPVVEGVLQVSYFDKVLNAVLLLSYVANKQSDSVGLMTFGGVDTYLPPKKGVSLIRNLLNETADIKPTMQTSDYLLAAQTLNRHLKKRSLVILITNTRAEANEELIQAVSLLARQHQIVFANLTEQAVYDRLHGHIIPDDLDDALLYHSLNNYEKGRQQLHRQLRQQSGTLCLHTIANKLPMRLTQAYLSLKR